MEALVELLLGNLRAFTFQGNAGYCPEIAHPVYNSPEGIRRDRLGEEADAKRGRSPGV
jgi:hypothetical protein